MSKADVKASIPASASSPARGEAFEAGERQALEEVLSRLPKAEAEVIALAFFAQLSTSEIAEQLGLSEERVTGRMRLGMRKLHRAMDARH